MVMVDHCGLPYLRDDSTMKLWKEGNGNVLCMLFNYTIIITIITSFALKGIFISDILRYHLDFHFHL